MEWGEIEADLAQSRFMLADPNNRHVADTFETEWNDKLRALPLVRKERESGRQQDQLVLDDATRQRLLVRRTDFKKLSVQKSGRRAIRVRGKTPPRPARYALAPGSAFTTSSMSAL